MICFLRQMNSTRINILARFKFTPFFQIPTTNSVTVLAPGPTMMEKSTGTKRKTSQSSKTDAMSMADRLKLLSTDQNAPSSTPPRTDSVLQLLLQGLNNKDRKILESVLERADDEQINNTVKRLPIEAIVPMLEELQHHIQVKIKLIY